MSLRDLYDVINKENRKKNKVKTTKKIAVGVGIAAIIGVAAGIFLAPKAGKETRKDMKKKAVDTVETIKDTVLNKVDLVKESAVQIAQDVNNVIHGSHNKEEGIKKDNKDSFKVIEQDVQKTEENISNVIN